MKSYISACSMEVVVCSRAVEETEASIEDVTDELDELRRSFTARLRSETLQRESDNLEKDSKIERLETILLSQLRREKAKDRKIAELEEKVEAIVQPKETPEQRQKVELLQEEQTTLLPKDAGIGPEMEKGRGGMESESRLRENTAEVAIAGRLSLESKNDTVSTPSLDEIQKFERQEKAGEDIAVHGRSLPAKQSGRRRTLSSLLKWKSRKIT